MGEIREDHFAGGARLQDGHGEPGLASLLRDVADDLSGAGNDWQSGLVVAAHTLVLPSAGPVLAVEATTATSAGVKQAQFSATPGAGFVRVEYDAGGIPTLTFNAADAVTAAAVMQSGGPSIRTTKT